MKNISKKRKLKYGSKIGKKERKIKKGFKKGEVEKWK